MPYVIEHVADKHYLHVTAKGDLSLAAARIYLERVTEVLEKTGVTRILFDASKGSIRFSVIDLIKLRQMVSESAESKCKRALVDTSGRSGLDFFESVSRSHGEEMRAFTDVDKALEWLLADTD